MNLKRLGYNLLIALTLLLIPLIAMQFSNEVHWSSRDFIQMGVLLFIFVVGFELLRQIKKRKYRILAMILCLIILLLIWAELSVGVFDTPFAGS